MKMKNKFICFQLYEHNWKLYIFLIISPRRYIRDIQWNLLNPHLPETSLCLRDRQVIRIQVYWGFDNDRLHCIVLNLDIVVRKSFKCWVIRVETSISSSFAMDIIKQCILKHVKYVDKHLRWLRIMKEKHTCFSHHYWGKQPNKRGFSLRYLLSNGWNVASLLVYVKTRQTIMSTC